MTGMLAGWIQDFLIGGSNLQRGFDLLIFSDFLKILNANEMIWYQRGVREHTVNPIWISHWLASSVGPGQMLQSAASDQGLHYLHKCGEYCKKARKTLLHLT